VCEPAGQCPLLVSANPVQKSTPPLLRHLHHHQYPSVGKQNTKIQMSHSQNRGGKMLLKISVNVTYANKQTKSKLYTSSDTFFGGLDRFPVLGSP